MKEITHWSEIKPGNIFVVRNQSLLGKLVGFWANGWAHCGVIYEENGILKTIEAKRRIITQPFLNYYPFWENGDLRVFDLEAKCWWALTREFEKIGNKYDWFGDIILFFLLPIQRLIWHLGYSYRIPISITKREKCSENVLLYLRDVKESNPKNKVLKYIDFMPSRDACLPADILKGCEEMCLLKKHTRK
jgi:hypothetical protein